MIQKGNTLNNKSKAPSAASTKEDPIVVQFLEGYPIRDPGHIGPYDASHIVFSTATIAEEIMKKEFDSHAFHTSIEVNNSSYEVLKTLLKTVAFPALKTIVLWSRVASCA